MTLMIVVVSLKCSIIDVEITPKCEMNLSISINSRVICKLNTVSEVLLTSSFDAHRQYTEFRILYKFEQEYFQII